MAFRLALPLMIAIAGCGFDPTSSPHHSRATDDFPRADEPGDALPNPRPYRIRLHDIHGSEPLTAGELRAVEVARLHREQDLQGDIDADAMVGRSGDGYWVGFNYFWYTDEGEKFSPCLHNLPIDLTSDFKVIPGPFESPRRGPYRIRLHDIHGSEPLTPGELRAVEVVKADLERGLERDLDAYAMVGRSGDGYWVDFRFRWDTDDGDVYWEMYQSTGFHLSSDFKRIPGPFESPPPSARESKD